MNPKSEFRESWWVILIGFIILVGISIALVLPYFTRYSANTWIDVTSTIMSLLLSLGLLFVYTRLLDVAVEQKGEISEQNKLQKKIVSIQTNQQLSMDANHKPAIQILDWECEYIDGVDVIEIELANKGNGLSKNIQVECEISVEIDEGEHSFYMPIKDYLRYPSPTGPRPFKSPVQPPSSGGKIGSGAILEAGKTSKFNAELQYAIDEFDDESKEIFLLGTSTTEEILNEIDPSETLLVKILLFHDDILGNTEVETVFSGKLERQGESNLTELLSK
ncbi:hypothetical protein [Haladaptatus sp. ZSTT2]|uniref:hypothetical protein n=1 Tax=Haladaptatus sp. ZSTT2 TaxID=3120515 RepID=UPI00300E742D